MSGFDAWNASRSGESYDGRYTCAPGCSYRERLPRGPRRAADGVVRMLPQVLMAGFTMRGNDSPGHDATGAREAPREQRVAWTACHGAEDAPEEPT